MPLIDPSLLIFMERRSATPNLESMSNDAFWLIPIKRKYEYEFSVWFLIIAVNFWYFPFHELPMYLSIITIDDN